jgi:hypothetical protein
VFLGFLLVFGFLTLARQLLRRLLCGQLAPQLGGLLLGLKPLKRFTGLLFSSLGQLVSLELRPRRRHTGLYLVWRRHGLSAIALGLGRAQIARQVDDGFPQLGEGALFLAFGCSTLQDRRQLDVLHSRHTLYPSWPKVRLWRALDPLIFQAAMIDAGFVAMLFQVQILYLGPALAGCL